MHAHGAAAAVLDDENRGKSPYRWVMLGLACFLYAAFSMVNASLTPLVAPVSEDLGLSRTAMGSVLGAWPFIYLFMALPAGAAIDKWGLKPSLLVGISFIALSQLLRVVSFDYITILLAVAVFGIGGPFISVGCPKLTTVWFNNKELPTAMGIYTVAPSIGSIFALSTANSVVMPLTGYSWRLTLALYTLVVIAAALAWFIFARNEDRAGISEHASTEPKASTLEVFGSLMRLSLVQIILIMSVGTFMIGHGFGNWLPEVLRTGGMTPAEAGFWASLPTVVGIAGALSIPRFITPARQAPMLTAIFAAQLASALLVGFTQGWPLYLGLVLAGIGRGVTNPLLVLFLARSPQVGPKNMGVAGGMYFTAGEIGGVSGPVIVGLLADMMGGFQGGLLFIAGVCGTLLVLTFVLKYVAANARAAEAATEPVPQPART